MRAPAARIPHSPPFSLPSSRGRAEGRALMSFGRGSMGFRNNLVSSLGRRNGIETNFIKQISLKRALAPLPPFPYVHSLFQILGRILSFRGARNRNREFSFSLVIRDTPFSDSFSQAQLHPHPRSETRYVFLPPSVLLQLPFETVVRSRAGGASRVQQGTESGARGARLRRHVRRMQPLPDRHGPREIRRG